jgi:serine/threonine protein kinase/tetratricopeptide (TPR) repeat protein
MRRDTPTDVFEGMRMDHPSSELLASLLDDRLEEPERSAVALHVDRCESCQTVIDDLASAELSEWRPLSSRTTEAPTCGPAFERVVKQAALGFDALSHSSSEPDDVLEILEAARHDDDLGALGPYRVRSVIGQGGMGVVFEAIDPALERTVALKVLRPGFGDAAARQRFVREAQAAARVKHDHVVTIFAVANPPDGAPYLAMEYLPGPTVRDLIVAQRCLSPRLAAELCAQAAEGVAAAHAVGLVHRDIKPNNILLTSDDSLRSGASAARSNARRDGQNKRECPWRAKIADFGIARPTEHSGTHTLEGSLCGTPAYISPEQIRDPRVVDGRCDVYSLGVTLYEMLTGEVPFRGTTPMVLHQAIVDEPRAPGRMAEGIPRDLDTICLKAMAKEPERRYASPQAFADDLRRWLRGEPIQARPSGRVEQAARWCRRNPRLAILSGTVAALVVCVVVASVTSAILIAHAQNKTKQALASAQDQRTLALDTLNGLIFRVQSILADRPGTLTLRQQILADALKNLERIARDAESGKIIDHNTIAAHQRIGDVLWISGRTDEARSHYQHSLELAATELKADPTSDSAKRDLAWGHDKLGVLDQHGLRLETALEHYKAALALREQAATHAPSDLESQRERIAAVNRLGDIASLRGDARQMRQHYERALNLAVALEPKAPNDLFLRRDIVTSTRKVAWAYTDLGEYPTAEKHLQRATTLLASLRASEPANLTWRLEEARIYQDFGKLRFQMRDYAGSIAQLQVALAAQTALVNSDPEHAEFQWDLAQIQNALTGDYLAQGDFARAKEHAASSADILTSLADRDPSSMKFSNDACAALNLLGTTEWRLGKLDDAERSYELALRRLNALQARGALEAPGMKALKSLLELLVAAMPFRQKALDSLEYVEQQPADRAAVLLCVRSYYLARAGRRAEAIATCDRAQSHVPSDPQIAGAYWYSIARTYGVMVTSLRSVQQPTDEERNQAEHCVDGAKDALKRCLAIAPYLASYVPHESELKSVR